MATIRQLDSEFWQAIIRRKGLPQQSKTFSTKRDADMWARDVESKIDRGAFIDRVTAEKTLLRDALKRYLKEKTPFKKGYEMETYRIQVWLRHHLADRSMSSLMGSDFAKYRDSRLSVGAEVSTIKNELSIISHLFNVAQKEWNINVTNPIQSVVMPKENNKRERRLYKGEEDLILKTFDGASRFCKSVKHNNWMPSLFLLAIETATRQSELLGMQWERVDLNARVVKIIDTKNGEDRDVPLSSRAVAILESLPRKVQGDVFPITNEALKNAWQRCLKRGRKEHLTYLKSIGKSDEEIAIDRMLVDLRWHDLRHESISRMADKLQLHELMKVTGHSESKMLARYYHPRAEDLAKKLG